MDSSGIYVLPNGCAYGSLFFEQAGQLLTRHDLMPTYFAAQVASGAIDAEAERRRRVRPLVLDTPAIVLNSISHWVYGHWLLDIWPRCWSARLVLGKNFNRYKVLVPDDSPAYALDILRDVLGVRPQQVVTFDAMTDLISAPVLVAPSLLHNSDSLHPRHGSFVAHAKRVCGVEPRLRERRIFLSRTQYRASSQSVRRALADDGRIEALFASRGFEIIHPQELGFGEQVALFDGARTVAGEAGSALHNSVFSVPGTAVISLSHINDVQDKIATAFNHHLITVHPDEVSQYGGTELQHYDLATLVRAIDLAESCVAADPKSSSSLR